MRREFQMGVVLLVALASCGCASLGRFVSDVIQRHDEICAEDPAACEQTTPTPTPAPMPELTPTPGPGPTPTPEPTPEPDGLPAPSGLTAVPHPWRISLSWRPEPWARAYRVYRGNLRSPIADVTGTSYEATELTLDDRWWFYVAGIDGFGAVGKAAARVSAVPTFPAPKGIEIVVTHRSGPNGAVIYLGIKADYGPEGVPVAGMSEVIPAALLDSASEEARRGQRQAFLWCVSRGPAGGQFGQVAWTLRHSSGATASAEPAPGHCARGNCNDKANYHTTWQASKLMVGYHSLNGSKGNSILVGIGSDLPAGSIEAQATCRVAPNLQSPVFRLPVGTGNAPPPARTD